MEGNEGTTLKFRKSSRGKRLEIKNSGLNRHKTKVLYYLKENNEIFSNFEWISLRMVD